jgi:hypothetical protein
MRKSSFPARPDAMHAAAPEAAPTATTGTLAPPPAASLPTSEPPSREGECIVAVLGPPPRRAIARPPSTTNLLVEAAARAAVPSNHAPQPSGPVLVAPVLVQTPAAPSVGEPASLRVGGAADGGDDAEPSAKRQRVAVPPAVVSARRAGRRAANPATTPEERRRQRTLSNRESAMRSLQKKAEFAARLEDEERTLREIVGARCDALKQVVDAAVHARAALRDAGSGHDALAAEVDDCIARCRAAVEDATEWADASAGPSVGEDGAVGSDPVGATAACGGYTSGQAPGPRG